MAGLTPLGTPSRFGHGVMHASTLYQAIRRFCLQARIELTNADFTFRQDDSSGWFCGGAVEGSDDQIQQVELYRIGMMVQVIRSALAEAWRPNQIELQSRNERSLQNTELFGNANIRFGCETPAVGIPLHALSLPILSAGDPAAAMPFDPAQHAQPTPMSLEKSLKAIIATQLRSHQGGIAKLARSLDLSVRTL